MTLKNSFLLLFMNLLFLIINGCYTFTGSSLSPEIRTVEIKSFPNYSTYQSPNLSVDFTVALQNRFNQRTKLEPTTINPDITIEGEIINFNTMPVNIQSGSDQATQNRLTVTVRVRYINSIESEKSFDRTFSDYQDYSSSELLVNIQDELSQKIIKKLIDQIFNSVVTDW